MSGRKTNSSLDIWGTHVPYLISVDAPKGESELKGYTDNVIVSKSEFKSAFLARHPEAVLSDSSNTWFKNFVRAPSGTVLSVEVGGVTVDGMSIRFLCGLRSADFTVTRTTGCCLTRGRPRRRDEPERRKGPGSGRLSVPVYMHSITPAQSSPQSISQKPPERHIPKNKNPSHGGMKNLPWEGFFVHSCRV